MKIVVKLTPTDIADLKRQGYSEDEISKAIGEIEKEDLTNITGSKGIDPRTHSQVSAFSSKTMNDIAMHQLELNDLLDQTEHILKGDIVVYKEGVKIWDKNPKPETNTLNKEGIRKVMLDLQTYINRHIILGDYDNRDINKIMKDYGKKFSNLIFMKYEEMGMDTEEKRQEYVSLVINIINLVYASYSRAKDGAERRSLREMINIQQSHQTGGMGTGMGGVTVNPASPKTRGILNPLRYIGGKYA